MATSVYLVFGLLLVGIGQISGVTLKVAQKMGKVLHRDCVAKTGVDEELIAQCKDGNLPEDPILKCYMKCLMTTVPIMKNGEIDLEFAISMLPVEIKDEAVPILRACGTVKGVDDCDTAYQTNKCWQSMAPEKYHLI